MPHTPMMTSVLQATLLFSLAQLFSHYSLEHAMDPFEQYQEAYKANRSEEILQAVNDRWLEAGAIPANMSVTNLTSTDSKASNGTTATSDEPVPFYTDQFPKAVVTILIMSFLRYYWLIWIERLLPARSRGSTGPSPARPSEKEDDDDAREEEIIRKWVESGKVRRASLNWCNTFLKWMLDMTAGNLWATFVEMVLVEVMKLKWPWTEWDKWVRSQPRIAKEEHSLTSLPRSSSPKPSSAASASRPSPPSSPSSSSRRTNVSSSRAALISPGTSSSASQSTSSCPGP